MGKAKGAPKFGPQGLDQPGRVAHDTVTQLDELLVLLGDDGTLPFVAGKQSLVVNQVHHECCSDQAIRARYLNGCTINSCSLLLKPQSFRGKPAMFGVKMSATRVIYFNLNEDEVVLLVAVYAKSDQANLAVKQINRS